MKLHKIFFRVIGLMQRLFSKMVTLIHYFPIYLFFRLKSSALESDTSSLVFIVGAPRTGSTILYQALTNCYDLKYIDNLAASWYKNLPFGMWLSNKKFGLLPHNNYFANHGNTAEFGEHAPSECGDFWYRWLSKDDHFVDSGETLRKAIKQIRSELTQVRSMFGLPLMFKNLNMGQRLRLIKQFAPEAKVVFIRRDPRFVVRSILKARAKENVAEHEWWSVKPKNFHELLELPETEMCAAQVFYIEEQIKQDLQLFPQDSVKTIQYNDLSTISLNSLAEWAGFDKKEGAEPPQFKKDQSTQLAQKELQSLQLVVEKHRFDKEVFC